MDKRRAALFFSNIPDMLPLMQTEWCEMDLGMDLGIVMAREIHQDLTILNVVAWSHWLAVSRYDYRDGLVYVDIQTRAFTCSKRMWAWIPNKAEAWRIARIGLPKPRCQRVSAGGDHQPKRHAAHPWRGCVRLWHHPRIHHR